MSGDLIVRNATLPDGRTRVSILARKGRIAEIGTVPAVITSFLVAFFPIMVNVSAGIAAIEPEIRDVLQGHYETSRGGWRNNTARTLSGSSAWTSTRWIIPRASWVTGPR